jgi:hypothetical protein
MDGQPGRVHRVRQVIAELPEQPAGDHKDDGRPMEGLGDSTIALKRVLNLHGSSYSHLSILLIGQA